MTITVSLYPTYGKGDARLHSWTRRIRVKHLMSTFWTTIGILEFNSDIDKVRLTMSKGIMYLLASVSEQGLHYPFWCNRVMLDKLKSEGWKYDQSYD